MAHREDIKFPAETGGSSVTFKYRFADIEYDESSELLRVGGADVELEPRPRALLSELLRRPGEVISKDELLELLWDGRPTVHNVLANAVTKLRRALGAAGTERIVTLPRVGYKFNGAVERVAVGQHAGPALAFDVGKPAPLRAAFRLERLLGHNQASPVWLARDPKLGLLRVFKFASDSERLTSLKREYTLYRVLRSELGEREDFAKVLAANFADAPYFLECEYGGQDLLAWAAEADRLAAMPLAERLALFLQIARAVAAAHGVGVLHKDLKPANVLISPDGEGWIAKLTDFGSSRLLEPGRLAALGVTAMGLTMTHGVGSDAMSGTPLYLAPELLAGHSPTTQSDLYALGLMLYQLLVGDLRRPMATGWQREIADELLREDLVAATEGKPEDRLGSVAELVERLSALEARRADRALRSQEAKRLEEAAARWQKSRARRPWLVGAFASLALGLALSVWFYTRANDALRQAEQASAQAALIANFLHRDVLEAPDIQTVGVPKAQSMLQVLRRASATVASRFASQPRIEAAVHRRLGETYMRLASLIDARAELDRAVALLSPIVPPDDTELLLIHFLRVRLMVWSWGPASAQAELERAEKDAGPVLLSGTNELTVLATRARHEFLNESGQYREALPFALRLVAMTDQLGTAENTSRIDARQSLIESRFRLGQLDQAKALMLELAGPPFNVKDLDSVFFAREQMVAAGRDAAQGRYAEAGQELFEAKERVMRSDRKNDFFLGWVALRLGLTFEARGDFGQALSAFETGQRAFEIAVGADHQYSKTILLEIAHLYLAMNKPADALGLFDKVDQWYSTVGRAPWPWAGLIPFGRAAALTQLGQAAQALKILGSLPSESLNRVAYQTDWRARIDAEKGLALVALGRAPEGAALLRTALADMRANKAAWPSLIAQYDAALRQSESAPLKNSVNVAGAHAN